MSAPVGIHDSNKVFIGGLSVSCSEGMLLEYLSQYGPVQRCQVVTNEQGCSKGYAFATFYDRQSMLRSVGTNHSLMGKRFTIKAHNDVNPEDEGPNDRSKARKLFVWNLKTAIKEKDLVKYFNRFGEVEEVVIIKDKFTRVSKGFGFVLFKCSASVSRIMRGLDTQVLTIKQWEVSVKEVATTERISNDTIPPRNKQQGDSVNPSDISVNNTSSKHKSEKNVLNGQVKYKEDRTDNQSSKCNHRLDTLDTTNRYIIDNNYPQSPYDHYNYSDQYLDSQLSNCAYQPGNDVEQLEVNDESMNWCQGYLQGQAPINYQNNMQVNQRNHMLSTTGSGYFTPPLYAQPYSPIQADPADRAIANRHNFNGSVDAIRNPQPYNEDIVINAGFGQVNDQYHSKYKLKRNKKNMVSEMTTTTTQEETTQTSDENQNSKQPAAYTSAKSKYTPLNPAASEFEISRPSLMQMADPLSQHRLCYSPGQGSQWSQQFNSQPTAAPAYTPAYFDSCLPTEQWTPAYQNPTQSLNYKNTHNNCTATASVAASTQPVQTKPVVGAADCNVKNPVALAVSPANSSTSQPKHEASTVGCSLSDRMRERESIAPIDALPLDKVLKHRILRNLK